MRGRKPKPVQEHILAGTFKRHRHGQIPAQPASVRLPCPAWLSKDAKKEWRRIVPELVQLGVLAKLDQGALASYCQAYAELKLATETIDQEGRIITDASGNRKKHPAIALQRDAMGRIRGFLAELGLSPSARTRLHAPPPAEKDPFEEFLAQKQSQTTGA